jgi:integrase
VDKNGRVKWRTTKARSERAAKKVAEKILSGTMPVKAAPARDITFADMEKKYLEWAKQHQAAKTIESRVRALKALKESSGVNRLVDVTIDDVERFKSSKVNAKGEAVKPRTVNEALGALKALVNRAKKQKWYSGPNVFVDVEPLPEVKRERRWLDKSQIATVLETARLKGPDAHLFFSLGIYAGLRKNEILNARWEWFDFEAGLVRVVDSEMFRVKTRESRTLPMHDSLRAILKSYRCKDGYLVAPLKVQGKNAYRFDPRKMFAAVVKKAKVEWCTPHTLRHTFASQLVSAGVSLFKVSTWLGHHSQNTTTIYSHLAPADQDINRF